MGLHNTIGAALQGAAAFLGTYFLSRVWGVIHSATRRDLVGKGWIIREIKELEGLKKYFKGNLSHVVFK
jgi:hypothetical protein